MMHVYSNEIKNIINLYQEKVEYRTKSNKQIGIFQYRLKMKISK